MQFFYIGQYWRIFQQLILKFCFQTSLKFGIQHCRLLTLLSLKVLSNFQALEATRYYQTIFGDFEGSSRCLKFFRLQQVLTSKNRMKTVNAGQDPALPSFHLLSSTIDSNSRLISSHEKTSVVVFFPIFLCTLLVAVLIFTLQP